MVTPLALQRPWLWPDPVLGGNADMDWCPLWADTGFLQLSNTAESW